MEFNLVELMHEASGPVILIMLVMAGMAVWCMYVFVDRLIALGRARKQSRALAEAVGASLKIGDAAGALRTCQDERFKSAYLGHVLSAGLNEYVQRPDSHGIKSAERAMAGAAVNEGPELRKGLSILATTGATAPFVGLVGTIFGIINAFQGMAESGSGGLASVSAGIAEALVATAIGITVAIIGVWLFNYFTARVESIMTDLEVASEEFMDWCHKQLLPPLEEAAK